MAESKGRKTYQCLPRGHGSCDKVWQGRSSFSAQKDVPILRGQDRRHQLQHVRLRNSFMSERGKITPRLVRRADQRRLAEAMQVCNIALMPS